MNRLLSLFIAFAAFSFFPDVSDAASRLGGGRSSGMQRQATPQQAPKAPGQQQATPNAPAKQPQAAPATPPQPQPTGWRRWLGPLAGLAIGAGLASLFMNNGLGGALLGMLLIAALVMGAVMLFRMLRGGRQTQHEPLQYVGVGAGRAEPTLTPPPAALGGGAAPLSVAAATQWPAGFNAEEFVRHAKANFVKLQDAHDRSDIDALRDFLTPDLLNEIAEDMRGRGNQPQKTEVVTLDADVLDVAAEDGQYIVSVRFSGLIRETGDPQPQPFSETWHLTKPVNGRSGWLVAGIQQT